MTPEQLLIPRYEATGGGIEKGQPNYPHSPFKVGDILSQRPDGYFNKFSSTFHDISQTDIDKYPHLFHPLTWYERRNVSDMPGYLKDEHGEYVLKVRQYTPGLHTVLFDDCADPQDISDYLPATEAEYNDYLTDKK